MCVYTECPSTLTDGEELCQRLEQLQRILKTEPEEEDTEPVDIVAVEEVQSRRVKVKQEQEEAEDEPKFFLGLCPSSQFIRDTAEQVIYYSGSHSISLFCCYCICLQETSLNSSNDLGLSSLYHISLRLV